MKVTVSTCENDARWKEVFSTEKDSDETYCIVIEHNGHEFQIVAGADDLIVWQDQGKKGERFEQFIAYDFESRRQHWEQVLGQLQ